MRVHLGMRLRALTLAAGATAIVLLATAAAANVFGNVTLSQLLTSATLASACASAAAAAAFVVFTGVLRAGVELPWARRFRIVRNHDQLLVRRGTALFRGAAFLAWAYSTLRAFGATGSFRGLAEAVLAVRVHVGALDVTAGDAAAFAVTLWISVWLSRALKFALDEAVLPALDVTRGRAAAVSTTVKYLVVAIGFSFAVLAAGMEVTRVTVRLRQRSAKDRGSPARDRTECSGHRHDSRADGPVHRIRRERAPIRAARLDAGRTLGRERLEAPRPDQRRLPAGGNQNPVPAARSLGFLPAQAADVAARPGIGPIEPPSFRRR